MTLDDLIALNDEIVALSRANSPVGEGLVQAGRDLPHRLGDIAVRVGNRLQAGESLEGAPAQRSGCASPLSGHRHGRHP